MYSYESLVMIRPDLPEAQVRETIDRAKRLIEAQEGVISETQDWGVRDLAYLVEKQTRGYYFLLRYNAQPEVVWEFERTLRIADEVMRFVTVRQIFTKPRKPKRVSRTAPPRPMDDDVDMEPMPEDF